MTKKTLKLTNEKFVRRSKYKCNIARDVSVSQMKYFLLHRIVEIRIKNLAALSSFKLYLSSCANDTCYLKLFDFTSIDIIN